MGKKKIFVTVPFLFVFLLSNSTQVEGFFIAKADDGVNLRAREEIKISDDVEEKAEVKANIFFREDKNPEDDAKAKQEEKKEDENKESEFKIDGVVAALNVSESSFVINGKTIFINTSKVSKFHQLGILAVGALVKVKGVIIDNELYAESINVVGTGQGRFQIKEENSLMVDIKVLLQQLTTLLKQRLNILSEVKI